MMQSEVIVVYADKEPMPGVEPKGSHQTYNSTLKFFSIFESESGDI